MHYWYWNNRDNSCSSGGEKREGGASTSPSTRLPEYWTEERLGALAQVGESVQARLRESSRSSSNNGFAPLLHAEWTKRFPDSGTSSAELEGLFKKLENREQEEGGAVLPWSPGLNRRLRRLAALLMDRGEYVLNRLLEDWRKLNPARRDGAEYILARLDDSNIPAPLVDRLPPKKPGGAKIKPEPGRTEPELMTEEPELPSFASGSANCLNARGQMRWTQAAVTNLLHCHQLAVAAKNRSPDLKLASVLHAEFKRRYPACPVGPSVLLTKCYIFRSEIKSGKLVIQHAAGGAGSSPPSLLENLSRSWTLPMLAELGPARRRAVERKRIYQFNNQSGVHIPPQKCF